MAKKININTRSDNEWKELLARYWKIETISLESPFKVIAKFVKSPNEMLITENMAISRM